MERNMAREACRDFFACDQWVLMRKDRYKIFMATCAGRNLSFGQSGRGLTFGNPGK